MLRRKVLGDVGLTAGRPARILIVTPGGLAQLGERDNGIVEVTGSSPVSSTKSDLRILHRAPHHSRAYAWEFSFAV